MRAAFILPLLGYRLLQSFPKQEVLLRPARKPLLLLLVSWVLQ